MHIHMGFEVSFPIEEVRARAQKGRNILDKHKATFNSIKHIHYIHVSANC